MDKAQLSMLLQLVKNMRTTNYATVAAMTLLKMPKKLASIIYLMGITIIVIISTVNLVLLAAIAAGGHVTIGEVMIKFVTPIQICSATNEMN
ncbi:hypothetical protein WG66_011614 [Moniliophthora roreri]|nr:hypothetical protein WG66_011614 [Moniliophthora roreri]